MKKRSVVSVVAAMVAATLCFSGTALQAQWFVGPNLQYLITTNTPAEVSRASPPSRLAFGVQLQKTLKSNLAFAFEVNYRTENGEMKTGYVAANKFPHEAPNTTSNTASTATHSTSNTASTATHSTSNTPPQIQVVEPGGLGPQVLTTLTSSSVEASAMLKIPMVDLDSSGTVLHLNLGALADRVLSTEQVDDYSQIPDYLGPKTVTVNYVPQFGFGAMFGVGVATNMGPGKLLFDLRFVFRNPKTALTNTTPSQEQDLSWLIGQGMRFGVSYLFSL
ncbi:MAG: hypothetical protein HQ472_10405 [Ignavibacteria bacterium]|nr:hypothetical protein [Ignavibacteria bacterium]